MKLRKKALKLRTEDIADIIIFGSSVKEKTNPADIDIALIFRRDIKGDVLKRFQDNLGERCHISSLTIDQFFTKPHSLAKTLLFEGISLITSAKMSENFGLQSFALYTYDLKKEKSSKKVRFVYLLKGRGEGRGIIEEFNGRYLSQGSFLLPVEKDEEMLEIFKRWGVKFYRKKVMLMN